MASIIGNVMRVSSLFFLAICTASCATPVAYETRSAERDLPEPDWDKIESALSEYDFTPFTLALVGEAERPEDGFELDPQSATDIAYCRNFAKKGLQSRVGSDFWKQSLNYDRQLERHLTTLVSESIHVQYLTWQAQGMYMDAIDFARTGDAAAAMNFNFGGHSKKCSEFASTLPKIE